MKFLQNNSNSIRKTFPIILALLFLSNLTFAQAVIQGIVKDSEEAPVIGATVVIKGTSIHSVSDVNGAFSINAAKNLPFTILVSSVGFKTQEIEIYEITDEQFEVVLSIDNLLSEVVVTARRRTETAQHVPIPISVVGGPAIENAGAFNVNRVKELVPSVQLYSSNPRNTTLNIRGLGSTFGLTNDGIDPGVGFYVDGVYYARPAATALDFVDIEQIEVLRGPQGTLFGKNTTAGAFNVKTRPASFVPAANFEVSFGNYGYIQAKSSITGPLSKKFAGRLSFSGTQRDGVLMNISTNQPVNDLNNLGVRGQLLFEANNNISITLAGDYNRQRPNGYAQVVAGVVQTQRSAYRQFDQIIADLNYELPSRNAFDRVVDHNTTWKSGNDLGGVSLNIDAKIGKGTLTSTSAWRYWNWDPSNDRDFTGLAVLTLSQATSKHQQWTQEIRYAGEISKKLSAVVGVFAIGQDLKTDPYHIEESGDAQWRFSQNSTSELWKTPGLLEGYGIETKSRLQTFGGAAFGQLDWAITNKLHLLPGLRYNYDKKDVNFDRRTYGGLQTDDPDLIALKKVVYTDQAFNANVSESNLSGQVTLSYRPTKSVTAFGTYATSYKPVGVNLGGLPTANGEVLTDLARVKPESVAHIEFGVKTTPTKNSIVNVTVFNTEIEDYQTQVQTAEVGVNRGYLANAEKVRVKGVEFDGNLRVNNNLSFNGAVAYTDGKYVKFTNAPVPLEETGKKDDANKDVAFKDISGGDLPGISKWAGSVGGEVLSNPLTIWNKDGKVFFGFDVYYRSSFSSSPSPSQYLNIDEYALVNGRFGFRATEGLSLFVWGRNLFNKDYYEQLLPAAGNAGHYAAVVSDPRTYGVTVRYSY
jgi:iron complex outermembrane recepter protein